MVGFFWPPLDLVLGTWSMPLMRSLGHHYMLWWINEAIFWLTKWPKHSILVNIYNWGAPVVGIDHCTQATKYAEYRSAISWHIWEHSVENPASPALNCWEYDRFKGFNGFIGLQWPSKASKTFKEAQRLQGVQRGSKTFKGTGWDWGGRSRERGPGSTTIKMERSTGVLQKCNTFCCDVADVQQCEQLTQCWSKE